MKKKIDELLKNQENIFKAKISRIIINLNELAELREDLNLSIHKDLKYYKNIKLLVKPKSNLKLIYDIKPKGSILFDGKRIEYFGGKSRICYDEPLENIEV